MSHHIPIELAIARAMAADAWTLHDVICEDPAATLAQKEIAAREANELDAASSAWYQRWQAVGGTSDITSIVEAEQARKTEAENLVAKYTALDDGVSSPEWWDGIEPLEY